MSKNFFRVIMVCLFLFAVTLTSLLGWHKYRALAYHPIDFPYYFQFAVKIFDPRYTQHFTLNPEGANVFGIGGVDGGSNLQQGLHFELMKYVEGAVIKIASWPPVVLIFAPIFYYLPLLYLFVIYKDKTEKGRLIAALLGGLYVFWPAALQATAFDLRPWAFLTPLLLALLLAFFEERSDGEVLLFFNLLFLVREEVLCFNAIFLLYYLFKNFKRWKEKARIIGALVVSYVIWTGVIVAYYVVQNFPKFADLGLRFHKLAPLLGVLVLVGGGVLIALFYFYRKGKNIFLVTDIAFPIILVVPFVLKIAAGTYAYSFLWALIFDPRPGILVVPLIIVVVVLKDYFQKRLNYIGVGLALVNLCIVVLFLVSANSPWRIIASYQEKSIQSTKLWEWHDHLDRFQDRVITDLVAYQAFSDFEHVLNYERLPQFITHDRSLWIFPENSKFFRDILPNYQFIIVQSDHTSVVERLAHDNGISFQKIDGDRYFTIYRINLISEKFPLALFRLAGNQSAFN
jgi:hypothetical protein